VVELEGNTGAPTETLLVQTVDYFPPVVDDPRSYGRIAAANALSDVYAMGGRAWSSLNLAGFPRDFSDEWIGEILAGGFDAMKEAGCAVAGGHTIQAEEALFGFAVTGMIERQKLVTNAGAKVGDLLYLTKPIGMGTMTTAAKRGEIDAATMEPAIEQMATLNRSAAEGMTSVGANACTDVTGFGLAGHARNIGAASGITMQIELGSVPIFDGAHALAARGFCSGGATRGREALGDQISLADGLDETRVSLAFDAETSGGLLISVTEDNAAELEAALADRGVLAARIGCVVEAAGSDVHFI
jgi:selenide,water dikinase